MNTCPSYRSNRSISAGHGSSDYRGIGGANSPDIEDRVHRTKASVFYPALGFAWRIGSAKREGPGCCHDDLQQQMQRLPPTYSLPIAPYRRDQAASVGGSLRTFWLEDIARSQPSGKEDDDLMLGPRCGVNERLAGRSSKDDFL